MRSERPVVPFHVRRAGPTLRIAGVSCYLHSRNLGPPTGAPFRRPVGDLPRVAAQGRAVSVRSGRRAGAVLGLLRWGVLVLQWVAVLRHEP